MGNDVTKVLEVRASYAELFKTAQESGNLEEAMIWQSALKETDAVLWKEMNEQGIFSSARSSLICSVQSPLHRLCHLVVKKEYNMLFLSQLRMQCR